MGKQFVCISLLAVILLGMTGGVLAAPAVSAQSAIVIDGVTGRTLYEKDADQPALIASTTKIMTGLLVCERCDLSQTVTVPAAACGVEGSSLYLKAGERITLGGLLYGMMLHSGNDAATALAILTCGSEAAFVAAMNQRAAELDLQHTHFANPHGLDSDGNFSTARDMARLAAAALKNAQFAQVVGTKQLTIDGHSLTNHNKLLWRYAGADGVKTGYTKAAGRILVSSATRESRQLICVTLNAPDDWQDHAALLDHGFAQLESRTILRAGQTLCTIPVADDAGYALLQPDQNCTVPLLPGEQAHVRLFAPRFLYECRDPASAAAVAQILVNGKVMAQCDLYALRPE